MPLGATEDVVHKLLEQLPASLGHLVQAEAAGQRLAKVVEVIAAGEHIPRPGYDNHLQITMQGRSEPIQYIRRICIFAGPKELCQNRYSINHYQQTANVFFSLRIKI